MRATVKVLARRAEVFPEGQLVVHEEFRGLRKPIASLSLQRFNYDGDPSDLPTWQALSGTDGTFADTYCPDGNALAMMSIGILPELHKQGLANRLIDAALVLACELDVEHLMGSYRPSQLGAYMVENVDGSPEFYIQARRADGLPLDPWLRALTRKGMELIRYDAEAMKIEVPLRQFNEYRLTPGMRSRVRHLATSDAGEIWLCGATGHFEINDRSVVYREANVWGKIGRLGFVSGGSAAT
ncbi:hypothetical protein [Paraburkholderia sp. RL17-373-BIF-A]|uniref:hypothetical protein n=1 Tax=Paraburkholderia sp. RL17-373-BIF-A TaxID=3031629 RepID=UPI0038B7EABE